MHYDINREALLSLAREIEAMAATTRQPEDPAPDGRSRRTCPEHVRSLCHGTTRLHTLPMAPLPEKEH